ncbi:hypothetical protein RJT34_20467 [Clitoria ternatea]|uniref:Uncharacterized protein n=1 Tax=Clitoria ternatea TaxID=43366 RepID=A0AAN9IT53_CLITE
MKSHRVFSLSGKEVKIVNIASEVKPNTSFPSSEVQNDGVSRLVVEVAFLMDDVRNSSILTCFLISKFLHQTPPVFTKSSGSHSWKGIRDNGSSGDFAKVLSGFPSIQS